jgi:hypothetical protein
MVISQNITRHHGISKAYTTGQGKFMSWYLLENTVRCRGCLRER